MIRVGVIGLGMMGLTHLDAYKRRKDVTIAAIADRDPKRLSGEVRAVGNVDGQAQEGVEALDCKKYADAEDIINDPEIDLVDICLPTPLHLRFGQMALESGKHTLLEKPLARTSADADALVAAAEKASGKAFVGMCMRFWPGWTWLKDAIDKGTYGKVHSATFRRVASHPGGPFYSNGELSGGALLDLHIHDTDFVHYCFGIPKAVSSAGYSQVTSAIDHVVTRYHYDDVPVVTAEGAWCFAAGFGFSMAYCVNFEQATATYELGKDKPLTLVEPGKGPAPVELEPVMGYDLEIDYFLDCINNDRQPTTVTLRDAANTIKICEAEARSVESGEKVQVRI
jgi:predicted dehydrogenase